MAHKANWDHAAKKEMVGIAQGAITSF
ncbi:MAG: hypothetical protein RLZZ252_1269, partial [Bacteroidota bacterium]